MGAGDRNIAGRASDGPGMTSWYPTVHKNSHFTAKNIELLYQILYTLGYTRRGLGQDSNHE